MQPQTIIVELTHPHSLRLLKELEQVNAIKLISVEHNVSDVFIPEWQKKIVRERKANSKTSEFTSLDDAILKINF
jgi:hypothetical protein